jgi:uncharacterized glyoxalase superfamily protein PhnB
MSAPISPVFLYESPLQMMDWLERAIGFARTASYDNPDGSLAHAEMALGASHIMIGAAREEGFGKYVKTPRKLGGPSQALYVAVDDADALHARAVAAGAEIVQPLTDQDYGSRDFTLRDPEGYIWSFGTYRPGDFEKG